MAVLAAAGDTATHKSVPLGDTVKNQGSLSVTARLTLGGGICWEMTAGDLQGPLASAEYAALQAGLEGRKAEQGKSPAGRVILAVDVTRCGAAWMRPARVWVSMLAQATRTHPIAADSPFAAVAVLRQRLTAPGLTEIGVAIHLQASVGAQREIEGLCEVLGWPHA
ncbi:hypothetical protein [Streptomyces sp. NPDC057686]|uniref:hypothetical protein n=1 Tax=Streptomyces sp. NPDC057686 TaxID=3346212 RepID=UPI0036CCD18D